ncbi:endonuclease [Candidatus Woesearchaeota archaeon]|nr:endonuclease [Candidatus Woesearchaeota archaeon]
MEMVSMLEFDEIYRILLKEHGPRKWWPTKTSKKKFEISVGAILTQNTNWINVEKALDNLIKHNLLSQEEIRKINVKKLAMIIKSSGYHNQKAKKLKEFIKFLDSKKQINRENLLNVWGIGKETADSILLYSYNQPIFVIDTYTKRIFNRLGFKEQSYDELQNLFMNNLKKDADLFKEYHALIVMHGKTVCKTKPLCSSCCLNKGCNFSKSTS